MMSRKPTHPGEILLEDVIKPLDLTITEAAKDLGVTRKTLSELVNDQDKSGKLVKFADEIRSLESFTV